MEAIERRSLGLLLIIELIFIMLLSLSSRVESSVSENRCDKTTRETFRTKCINCWQNRKASCPRGSRKQTRGSGSRGCIYDVRVGENTMPARGCTHTCGHTVTTERCCDGYWGRDCESCPRDLSGAICGGKGTCFDGIEGNGTCACHGNLAGAFCEHCSQLQFYGPTCQSICACVNGVCDSGINGTGSCFCTNGYGGSLCDQVLSVCSTLNCDANSACLNITGVVKCHCNKGYEQDGTSCSEIDPCKTGNHAPCHSQASCVHTGPDQSECSCNDGYSGDGYWCAAIDPCETNNGGCPVNSTTCVYDGPAIAHCDCLSGFENLTAGSGCKLKDICGKYETSTCDPIATCQTIVLYGEITVKCECPLGFVERSRICYADILTELDKLNQTGIHQNKLNLAIAFFQVTYKELLFNPSPTTLFVPLDTGFPPSLRNNISSDPLWKLRARAHIVPGTININFTVDSAKTMYPLLGSDYPISALRPSPENDDTEDDDDLGYFATIKFGGRTGVRILVDARFASNGLLYVIDTMLEPPDQEYFISDSGVLDTIQQMPGLGGFMHLISKSFVFRRKLLEVSSYSLFAPTSDALKQLGSEEYKYLTGPRGQPSLDILLQYHLFTDPTSMLQMTRVQRIQNSGVITVNVSQGSGLVTVGEERAKVTMAEVAVKGGNIFIYLVDKILIPDVLKPLVTNLCNITKTVSVRGPCGHCGRSLCPPGGVVLPKLQNKILTCVYKAEVQSGISDGQISPHMGCNRLCSVNITTTSCCQSFYGSECRSCPGPTHQACNNHGICSDGETGTGLCECEENFTGLACSKCVNETKYGPNCDLDCPCRNGTCRNSIDSRGECLPDSCADGWAGENCDRPLLSCQNGTKECHQFASCVRSSNGTEMCTCDAGYTGSGDFCFEFNPCQASGWGGCDVNAYCLHLGAGITSCECPPNYAGDGYACVPVDPCSTGEAVCSVNGICVFTGPGESSCMCKTGYRGDGKICSEINICHENNGGCHQRAQCTSTGPGTRSCKCFAGYEGDGLICLGNVLQEIAVRSDLSRMRQWIAEWSALRQMFISLNSGFTCFLPDDSAWASLSSKETAFWITPKHFPYLMKNHILPKKLLASALTTLAGNSVETSLETVRIDVNKVTVDTSDINVEDNSVEKSTLPTLGKDYAKLLVSDLPVSGDGIIHIIDSVLLPPRDVVQDYPALSEIAKNTTGTKLEPFTQFLQYLVRSGVIDQIEETYRDSQYTLFVAPNTSPNFPPSNATPGEVLDILRYHVIPHKMLRASNINSGQHEDTLLGVGYKVTLVQRHGKLLINGQEITAPDIRTENGIVHGLSSRFLSPIKTRCDGKSIEYVKTLCLPCFYPNRCPLSSTLISKNHCLYKHITGGEIKTTVGCSLKCAQNVDQPKCCSGFYGSGCEPCPGGVSNVCFGLGTCQDGIKGNGSCTCTDPKHAGIACDTCSSGRYGRQCDLLCKCVNGTCNNGINGDGTCICDKGFRGPLCDQPVDTSDKCKGTCHSAANCVSSSVGSGGSCQCISGYQGNGTYCNPIDPCKSKDTTCGQHAFCKYISAGLSRCVCEDNYVGDGVYCSEINPCQRGYAANCSNNGYCVHTGPNEANCLCNPKYEGDGKTCSPVDLCRSGNGGCSADAICKSTGPGERECECKEDFVGNGVNCTGSIQTYVAGTPGYEWFSLLDTIGSLVPHAFSSLGPLAVFLPAQEAILAVPGNLRSSKEQATQLYLNHIVSCATFEGLANVSQLRTLAGSVLNISKTDSGYVINNQISIQGDPMEFWNGVLYHISKPLVPEFLATMKTYTSNIQTSVSSKIAAFLTPYSRANSTDAAGALNENSKTLTSRGFSWVSSILNKSGDIALLQEEIHQKWTLFLPTDDAFSHMPPQKLRLLFNDHSYVSEYIRYHMVRQSFFTPIEISPEERLKTLQGSDVTLRCKQETRTYGTFTVNGAATVTGFRIFPIRTVNSVAPAAVYILDKVLDPPSLGGRCDIIDNVTVNTECKLCFGKSGKCPFGTLQVARTECRVPVVSSNTVTITGCQLKCSSFNVTHRCCKHYYGPDCHPCPGGALKPCSGNGLCSEGLNGTGVCTCKSGFVGYACERCAPGSFGRNCHPCQCSVYGTCNEGIDRDGACFCDAGWTGPKCDQKTTAATNCDPPCHGNGYCVKSGTCFCKPGYRGDGVNVCEFMNMCQVNNGGCSPYGTCSIVQDRVVCKCLPNFVGDGYACEGYDPCTTSTTGCHALAHCIYVGANTSRCECNNGYHGDGIRVCLRTQATNCATNNGGCSGHAMCVDVPTSGGYPKTKCTCRTGYVGDGYVCHGTVFQVISESVEMREFYRQLRRQSPRMRKRLNNPMINMTMFVPADMQGRWRANAMPYYAVSRHFIVGRVYTYNRLMSMKGIVMQSGEMLPIWKNSSNNLFVNGVNVRKYDIIATNGIIHLVDSFITKKIITAPTGQPVTAKATLVTPAGPTQKKPLTKTTKKAVTTTSAKPMATVKRGGPIDGGGVGATTTSLSESPINSSQTAASAFSTTSKKVSSDAVSRRRKSNGIKIGISVLIIALVLLGAGLIYWWKNRNNYVFRPFTERQRLTSTSDPMEEETFGGLSNPAYDSTGFNTADHDEIVLTEADVDTAVAMQTDTGPFSFENPSSS